METATTENDSETGGASSACVADHCQLIVHVEEKTLRGGLGRSDLPIDSVKRLACDGSVLIVTEDERGTPLDVRDPARRARRDLLPTTGRAGDSEGRLPARRYAR